jgi:hypothetical protein
MIYVAAAKSSGEPRLDRTDHLLAFFVRVKKMKKPVDKIKVLRYSK